MSDAPLSFTDIGLLLAFHDAGSPEQQRAAAEWMRRLWLDNTGRLDVSVLSRLYEALTRGRSPGLPRAEARQVVRELAAWQPAVTTARTLNAAWQLEDRFELGYDEALLVGAAKVAGCRYLLTDALPAGRDLDGLLVVDPLTTPPGLS
ncbi:MAG: hypothetical protein KC635_29450 [Myxococcales bacterium]|nr:hypothetical protein [Myxococcales bacterium]MCB9733724.1 VapC toxin family PIN domain ribonuclease [Deltaproteobacteria bacterium]